MHSPEDNISAVEQLMSARDELAKLSGFRSFAHYTTADATLAGTPEAIHSFLDGLGSALGPQVRHHVMA